MINRIQLKEASKLQISGKIGLLFLIYLIIAAISIGASFIPLAGPLVNSFFFTPCFSFSLVLIYMSIASGGEIEIGDVFKGFYYYWGTFKIQFLAGILVFLWSLLFIVPGVIKTYSYSMALFIYAENPGMGAREALRKSEEMMEGHKMDFFVLQLSFIGWHLLGFITFALAYVYVIPYIFATSVNFYYAIKPAANAPEETPEAPAPAAE